MIQDTDVIIVVTRPGDVRAALETLNFNRTQIIICVAAGINLNTLKALVKPGTAIRVLPISCAMINLSPILMYPENQTIRTLV